MKIIHWLVPHKLKNSDDISYSNLASIRLRAGLFNQPIFKTYKVNFNESISNSNEIDFLFVGKFAADREDLFDKWHDYIENHRKFEALLYNNILCALFASQRNCCLANSTKPKLPEF